MVVVGKFRVNFKTGSSEPLEHFPLLAKMLLELPTDKDDTIKVYQAGIVRSRMMKSISHWSMFGTLQGMTGKTLICHNPWTAEERCCLFVVASVSSTLSTLDSGQQSFVTSFNFLYSIQKRRCPFFFWTIAKTRDCLTPELHFLVSCL
jgi:hypothetical protein